MASKVMAEEADMVDVLVIGAGPVAVQQQFTALEPVSRQ